MSGGAGGAPHPCSPRCRFSPSPGAHHDLAAGTLAFHAHPQPLVLLALPLQVHWWGRAASAPAGTPGFGEPGGGPPADRASPQLRSSPPSSMGTRQQSESSGVSGQAKSPPVRLAPWLGSAGAWGAPTSSLPWQGAPRQGTGPPRQGTGPPAASPGRAQAGTCDAGFAQTRCQVCTPGVHPWHPSGASLSPRSCPHTPAPISRRWPCRRGALPSTVPARPAEQLQPWRDRSQASAAARCMCGQGTGHRR